MKTLLCLTTAVALFIAPHHATTANAQQPPPAIAGLPEPARLALDECVDHVLWRYAPDQRPFAIVGAERFANFGAAMDRLAAAAPPGLAVDESRSLEEKLIALARDRAARPERYEEIRLAYPHNQELLELRKAPIRPRAVILLGIEPQHQIEEYRLALEYFLLAPPLPDGIELYSQRMLEALANMGDVRSNRTFISRYLALAEMRPTSGVEDAQGMLIRKLARHPRPQNLRAILECAEIAQNQVRQAEELGLPDDHDALRGVPCDPLACFLEGQVFNASLQITSTHPDFKPLHETSFAAWRGVIEAFPGPTLPAAQQPLFDKLKADFRNAKVEPKKPRPRDADGAPIR